MTILGARDSFASQERLFPLEFLHDRAGLAHRPLPDQWRWPSGMELLMILQSLSLVMSGGICWHGLHHSLGLASEVAKISKKILKYFRTDARGTQYQHRVLKDNSYFLHLLAFEQGKKETSCRPHRRVDANLGDNSLIQFPYPNIPLQSGRVTGRAQPSWFSLPQNLSPKIARNWGSYHITLHSRT